MRIAIGTSGFAYKEWKGSFYPARTKPEEMLPFYASKLGTVEINNTFYALPKPNVMAGWAAQVPAGFSFAVKANRRITHIGRLKNAIQPTEAMLRACAELGDKLGPLLFGLPPNMKKDVARLREFVDGIPRGPRVAFEFRHDSWFDDEVYDVLRGRDAALCIAEADDDDGLTTPLVATAGWGYLRLRKADYDAAALRAWAGKIKAQRWSDAVVYFKHEDGGTGPRFAAELVGLVK